MNEQQIIMILVFIALLFGLGMKSVGAVKSFAIAAFTVYVVGLVSTEEFLAKCSSQVTVTLLLVMLTSIGLERFTWIKKLASKLLVRSYVLTLLRLGLFTVFTSAFLNNTAVVATLMHYVRHSPYHSASRLLIPLSYTAIIGGTMTLIGTSTNLIVAALYADATGRSLAFFDFFGVGFCLTIFGVITILLFAKLLPERPQAEVEIEEYVVEAKVCKHSPLVGRTVMNNGLRELPGLFLVEIVRGGHLVSPVSPNECIEPDDKLIFSGDIKKLDVIEDLPGVVLFATEEGLLRQNLVEVIVLPNAVIEGKTIKASGFRALFNAAVVGMRRGGRRLSGQLGHITIKAGDSLILAVGGDFYSRQNLTKNFAILGEHRLTPEIPPWREVIIGLAFLLTVVGASLGWFSLIKGLMVVLGMMLLSRMVQTTELRGRFPFELWMIITAALVVSQAMINSGLTVLLSDWMRVLLSGSAPYVALIGIYILTVVLTELVTNNAAAALVFPLAFGVAESLGVSVLPFSMVVAYGASASFLTPYGYATNLMVQNVGGYGLCDYLKMGTPLSLVYGIATVCLVPVFFPL